MERIPAPPPRSYVLFRRSGRVMAADGGPAHPDWPTELVIDGRRYAAVPDPPGTMLFWDELITPANELAGFTFSLFPNDVLAGSRLVRAANSTATDYTPHGSDWRVELTAGPTTWDCVQGFGSVTFQTAADPTDCALWLMNWSGRPPAFSLVAGVT